MTTVDRRVRLAEAAERYYVDGWNQDQVATHLGTSRSNVSRLLEVARAEGIVRFVIDHPLRRAASLERAMRAHAPNLDIRVIDGDGIELVGRAGAGWLVEHLDGAKRIAIGWGRTVATVIDHVSVMERHDVEIVQVGGDLTMAPAPSGHELVRHLADALGGSHRFLHAPAVVEDAATAKRLRSERRIAEELDRARQADIALVGIGVPRHNFAESAGVPPEAAAAIATRLIDDSGTEVTGPLRDRVIAIDLADLASIPSVLGVAAGTGKARAVVAAARSGIFDTLICDRAAALSAVDHWKGP
ncbi:MAG: sugar-binding domain-containing protein [Acidimicrobiia bacterium]